MKLVQYGKLGREKPGLIDNNGDIRDLSSKITRIDANVLSKNNLEKLKKININSLKKVRGKPRLGVPISGIRKIVCIGLNYADHAKETNSPIPMEPIIFMKPTSSLNGPYDDVVLPRGILIGKKAANRKSPYTDSKRSDWEVELGIVIGETARSVSESKSMQHVAGFTIVNDVSERAYQLDAAGKQWIRGKGCDTFCPVGPWLVTRDEVKKPQNLNIWLELNGKKVQDGNTKTMIFGVKTLVSYVSHFMSLEPGDVIATGTPPGVGMGMKPAKYLKPGDEMRVGIEGLGEQFQKVVKWKR